ncbi:MAG: cyclic pyranopterin monophosphate synthase MoaC [Bdellovibrionota bacterium]|nr:cyclic pyranopterin monophosphate synthase MoaC [Bdellovibrionota bacterium]
MELTHIDEKNNPKMVDVTQKEVTHRLAEASCMIEVDPLIMEKLHEGEIQTKKGPVFHTAIIAGTMAVKKTSDLIPFCHPLAIEGCDFDIKVKSPNHIHITCKVKISGKTGVEMEALTGTTVAALTIYDMCKAITHKMIIKETKLVEKTGGKRTVRKETQ